jgi:hypothetical protein
VEGIDSELVKSAKKILCEMNQGRHLKEEVG